METFPHLYIGCDTGLLKGVRIPSGAITNTVTEAGGAGGLVNKERAVDVLIPEAASADAAPLRSHKLRLCLKNRDIVCLNMGNPEEPFARLQVDGGQGRFVGAGMVERNTVTAVESGDIFLNEGMQRSKKVASAGDGLSKLIQGHVHPNHFATGGRNNHLKVWDLSAPASPLFTAKNLPDDKLRLSVPTFIRCLAFRPASDDKIILTATAYHQVQTYDIRAHRRPVRSFDYGEDPLTCLDVNPAKPDEILLANRLGKVAVFDWRGSKALQLRAYTGAQGSVKQVLFHPLHAERFAVCGMDRFVRLYDTQQKAPIKEIYLKSQPVCMLWTDEIVKNWDADDEESVDEAVTDAKKRKADIPAEDDGIWNEMRVVDDNSTIPVKVNKTPINRKKKRQINSNIN